MAYDIIIRNGFLIDGTGMPWSRRDVAVTGGRIVRVGRVGRSRCRRVIDATGLYVSPGFIDIHTHSDMGIVLEPEAESVLRQGVTTQVVGNCGDSAAPVNDRYAPMLAKRLSYFTYSEDIPFSWVSFDEYLSAIEILRPAINIAALVGHSTVRIAAMGMEEKAPSRQEMSIMKRHVQEAMRAGAFGISSGLVYPPGCYASTDELVALAALAARYGGFYASHVRGERETIVDAVRECIDIGRRARCAVQISHNNPKYGGWGKGAEIQELWEKARSEGIDVMVDNDIHTDFAPSFSHLLPQTLQGMPMEELIMLLSDADRRRRVKKDILDDRTPAFGPSGLLIHGRFDCITVLSSPSHSGYEGKKLASIAEECGKDPFDLFFDLIVDDRDRTVGLFDYQDSRELRSTIAHRLAIIASDGWIVPLRAERGESPPYVPCSYGEFPGILERIVRQERLLTLEDAIRKITSMPAARLGLQDRGIIREGSAADITIFDLDKAADRATGFYPHEPPQGIVHVLVNGIEALSQGRCLPVRSGKVIRNRHSF